MNKPNVLKEVLTCDYSPLYCKCQCEHLDDNQDICTCGHTREQHHVRIVYHFNEIGFLDIVRYKNTIYFVDNVHVEGDKIDIVSIDKSVSLTISFADVEQLWKIQM